jgi:hypothetical protein
MNLSAWTSRTETPGMLAVFGENRSRRVEDAGGVCPGRALAQPKRRYRDFRALHASAAGTRALGSTFRRSRDFRALCQPAFTRLSPQ